MIVILRHKYQIQYTHGMDTQTHTQTHTKTHMHTHAFDPFLPQPDELLTTFGSKQLL